VAIASNSARLRGFKNSLAKWLITVGGISVLFTLVLIFLYLLYVIKPIFESVKIESSTTISFNTSGKTLNVGVDELKEVAYQINEHGVLNFYQLKESENHRVGAKVSSQKILSDDEPLKFIAHDSTNKFLFVSENGSIKLIATHFKAVYDNSTRTIIPSVIYPLEKENLIIDESPENGQQSFKNLAFAMDDEKAINEKQEMIIQQNNTEKWYLFGGLAIVSLFGLLMFNRFKITNRQKKKISIKIPFWVDKR